MRFYQPASEEALEMNMTPLLDVLFVLLILFILVAPLLQIDRIALAPAIKENRNVKTANYETRSALVIQVDQGGHIRVNQQPVELNDLHQVIKALKIDRQCTPILIQDQRSEFGVYQTIKQHLESLSFTQLDVVLQP